MKIILRFKRHSEKSVFSEGDIFMFPAPFFRYTKFGKNKSFRIGIFFMKYEFYTLIRNKLKLTKQTTDQGRIS